MLCDEHGKTGETHHVLAPGDDPRRIAGRLRRAAWQSEEGRSIDRYISRRRGYGGY
jgi:hypothetical protein